MGFSPPRHCSRLIISTWTRDLENGGNRESYQEEPLSTVCHSAQLGERWSRPGPVSQHVPLSPLLLVFPPGDYRPFKFNLPNGSRSLVTVPKTKVSYRGSTFYEIFKIGIQNNYLLKDNYELNPTWNQDLKIKGHNMWNDGTRWTSAYLHPRQKISPKIEGYQPTNRNLKLVM